MSFSAVTVLINPSNLSVIKPNTIFWSGSTEIGAGLNPYAFGAFSNVATRAAKFAPKECPTGIGLCPVSRLTRL